jgi:energy-converting hydrogenase A subunit M
MNNKSKLNLDSSEKWHELKSREIQDFLLEPPENIREKLEYSLDSLDVLSSWLIDSYSNEDEISLHRGVSYYVGEVYRIYLEGHWNVHFKELEPDYEFGEQPVIEGFHHDVALCPLFDVFMTIKEKDITLLHRILTESLRMYKSKRFK